MLWGAVSLVLPYFVARSVSFFGFPIHLFAVLVGAAMLTGFLLATSRGRRYGIPRERIALFSLFLIAGGLVGARLGRIFYQPDLFHQADLSLSRVLLGFHGIASFGAYFGGLLGALLFFRFRCASRLESLRYLDTVGFALPSAWCLGRIGCALVHDHPGIHAVGWLAIAYPDGPRYDLGFLEALFLLLLTCFFLLLQRRERPAGFFFALYFTLYGPFRFLLDQLHVDPPRYFGWSVDQYGASLAFAVGLLTWIFVARFANAYHLTTQPSHGLSYSSVSET